MRGRETDAGKKRGGENEREGDREMRERGMLTLLSFLQKPCLRGEFSVCKLKHQRQVRPTELAECEEEYPTSSTLAEDSDSDSAFTSTATTCGEEGRGGTLCVCVCVCVVCVCVCVTACYPALVILCRKTLT